MKKLVMIFSLLLFLTGCGQEGQSASEISVVNEQANYTQLAISAATKISENAFDELYQMLDEQMQSQLSRQELESAWRKLLLQMGELQYYSSNFSLSEINGIMVADIPFIFAHDQLMIELSFNNRGEISAIYFLDYAAANSAISLRLPNDQEITFGEEPYLIQGSLTLPEGDGPFAAVILLHDYGPVDRNAQIGPNRPFFDLAQQLSAQQIEVLRFDKRSYLYAEELAEQKDFTIYDDIIDDAVAAFYYLAGRSEVDPQQIYFAAFGVSGQLIPRLEERLPQASGYFMLNTTARTIEDTMLSKYLYTVSLENELTAENEALLVSHLEKTAENIRTLTADSSLTADELLGAPASYWLDLQHYEPLNAIKSVQKPLLVIQGGRDFEIGQDDFEAWQAALSANPLAQCQYFGNLNHLLMEGVGKSNPQEYQVQSSVSSKVIEAMVTFIEDNSR